MFLYLIEYGVYHGYLVDRIYKHEVKKETDLSFILQNGSRISKKSKLNCIDSRFNKRPEVVRFECWVKEEDIEQIKAQMLSRTELCLSTMQANLDISIGIVNKVKNGEEVPEIK